MSAVDGCALSGRWWCTKLASAIKKPFAETDVRHIVGSNLRYLLGQCRSADALVRKSAHYILRHHGSGGLPAVKQLIAEAMLCLMENLLPESGKISGEASKQFVLCTQHLGDVLRALEKPQRQRWASLLVRFIHEQQKCHKELIHSLKLLWRADDDPNRSYPEAEQHLWAFAETASTDVRGEFADLLVRC